MLCRAEKFQPFKLHGPMLSTTGVEHVLAPAQRKAMPGRVADRPAYQKCHAFPHQLISMKGPPPEAITLYANLLASGELDLQGLGLSLNPKP